QRDSVLPGPKGHRPSGIHARYDRAVRNLALQRPAAAGKQGLGERNQTGVNRSMVSFEPSEDQRLLQETVAAFAVEQIRPLARDADERGAAPESVVAKAWELGLVSSAIPESYGGFGDAPSALTGAIVLEELGYGDLSIALHVLAPRLLVYPLLEHGTEEQKQLL